MFFFKSFFAIVNYILIIGLLLSYLAPHISPENFWFIAFFGLAYPIFLILNILFVIFWLIQFNIRFIFSLLAIAAGYHQISSFAQINIKNATIDKVDEAKAIKVMSYNVRVFDLYNWSHNKETRNKMLGLIGDESPDILCLQEFYADDSRGFNTLDTLLTFPKKKNYHIEYTTTLQKMHHWGIATFTKYPIVNKGKIIFEEKSNNLCIYTDIKVDDDTVRIYNMHLQSIHFDYVDYRFVDSLSVEKLNEKDTKEKSKSIFRRLKNAFIKRAGQVDIVSEHIRKCPYPVIVCGDFNDTPSSYTYHTISKNLKDAFVESGNGLGRTYTGSFPSFRIDYILYSPQFKSYEFHTIPEKLSDHYPVNCYLEILK